LRNLNSFDDWTAENSSVSGDTIPILVGTQTFYVHETLLVSNSRYFQNALKPEWRTDTSKPINMFDTDQAHFKSYSQWLYTKQAPKVKSTGRWKTLAMLYILGERIMDDEFQNVILEAMIALRKNVEPNIQAIRSIYAGTTSGSPARRLLVGMSAVGISSPTASRVKRLKPETDGEFMMDLIAALVKYRKKPAKSTLSPWIAEPHFYRVGQDETPDKMEE
jgi:hypothetical protein